MTKKTYTTILLFLFVSISTFANNKTYDSNCEKSTKVSSKEITIIKVDTNTVSLVMKYNLKKHSSRKSKMDNLINYFKNPENLDRTSDVLC